MQPHPAPGQGSPLLGRFPAPALVLGGVVSIQFGAGFAATAFEEAGAAGISMLRLGVAAIVMYAFWRPRLRGRPRTDLRLVAAFGAVLGLMNYTFYEALDRIPLGIAVTIEFIGPLGVALLGARRRLDVAWALLAGAGIVLLVDPGGGASLDALGAALAAFAGLCWGAYILLAARVGTRFDGASGLAAAMVIAALVPLGPGLATAGSALLEPEVLAIGVAVALLSSVVPYTLETEALRRMPANVFGVLMSLEPGVAALAGFLVLGQDLGARELGAIALVVAASAGVTRAAATPPPRD